MKTPCPLSLVPFLFTTLLLHLHPTLALYDTATNFLPASNPAPSASSTTTTNNDMEYIRSSCQSTLYPDLCYNSLSGYATAVQQNPARLAKVAIGVSLSRVKYAASYFSNLSKEADYGNEPRVASALHDCFSVFGDAVDQLHDSMRQMKHLNMSGSGQESFRFQMSNIQTWMSAALTNEDTCTDGFQYVPDGPMKTDVCDRVQRVEQVTSNALAFG